MFFPPLFVSMIFFPDWVLGPSFFLFEASFPSSSSPELEKIPGKSFEPRQPLESAFFSQKSEPGTPFGSVVVAVTLQVRSVEPLWINTTERAPTIPQTKMMEAAG